MGRRRACRYAYFSTVVLLFLLAILSHPVSSVKLERAELVIQPDHVVVVKGLKGPTGPTGPDGSDGVGLHLRPFKIGEKYHKGDYVFSKAPNHEHDAMYVAEFEFVARAHPYDDLDHWVELSKG